MVTDQLHLLDTNILWLKHQGCFDSLNSLSATARMYHKYVKQGYFYVIRILQMPIIAIESI